MNPAAKFYRIISGASLATLNALEFELWNVAYCAGAASRDYEVQALQREADRLWLAAFAPKDRRDYLLQRLDAAFVAADAEADLHNLLEVAWAKYLESLNNVREAVPHV